MFCFSGWLQVPERGRLGRDEPDLWGFHHSDHRPVPARRAQAHVRTAGSSGWQGTWNHFCWIEQCIIKYNNHFIKCGTDLLVVRGAFSGKLNGACFMARCNYNVIRWNCFNLLRNVWNNNPPITDKFRSCIKVHLFNMCLGFIKLN